MCVFLVCFCFFVLFFLKFGPNKHGQKTRTPLTQHSSCGSIQYARSVP